MPIGLFCTEFEFQVSLKLAVNCFLEMRIKYMQFSASCKWTPFNDPENGSMSNNTSSPGDDLVYTPYITKNGKRIYHPTGGLFVFPDKRKKADTHKA